MKKLAQEGYEPIDTLIKPNTNNPWTVKEKLLLGLSPQDYMKQLLRNPFNWFLAVVYAVGIPLLLGRFFFGLGWATHGSYDYPWGLFLGWGLFVMVPLSASGFMLGTTVELFGRKDFKPIERLGLLNGLLGYFFAVVFLEVDLGQPWRLVYPMFVSLGPAAVLFLVAWHVATYLTVQIAELVPATSELMGWVKPKKFVKSIVLGLTVAGIILSTLHQGALGSLFTYAPHKLHPLWISTAFQWILFFCSSIFGGLSMLIVVSALTKWFMSWRCDDNFLKNLDRITIGLGKGCSMALITYLVLKITAIAHDNEWSYLLDGWGMWFFFEMIVGTLIPLAFFTMAIRTDRAGLARFAAMFAVFGIALNRMNTVLITYNWEMYQDIPHWREFCIAIMVYFTYIVVYRAVLYRIPIVYTWRGERK